MLSGRAAHARGERIGSVAALGQKLLERLNMRREWVFGDPVIDDKSRFSDIVQGGLLNWDHRCTPARKLCRDLDRQTALEAAPRLAFRPSPRGSYT